MEKIIKRLISIDVFLAIILVINVLGMIFPYGFPLFFPLVFFYFYIYFIIGKLKIKKNIGVLVLGIAIIQYIWGIVLTGGVLYSNVISDLTNIMSIIMVILILGNLQTHNYQKFIYYMRSLGAFIIGLLATFSLYKYWLLINGITFKFFYVDGRYPWGTSLVVDYNMFALGLIIGLIFAISGFIKEKRYSCRLLYIFVITLILMAIIFSGSRRGWVVIALMLAIAFIYLLYKIVGKFKQLLTTRKIKVSIQGIMFCIIVIALSIVIPTNLGFIEENKESYEVQKLLYRFESLLGGQSPDAFLPRTDRWEYGISLTEQANIIQIFFGQGFDYLKQYANEFNVSSEDYPHNPVVSALLYAGVFGAFVALVLLFIPIYYLYKNYSAYGWEIALIYIFSVLFLLISSNSIFSDKVLLLTIAIIVNANIKVSQKK